MFHHDSIYSSPLVNDPLRMVLHMSHMTEPNHSREQMILNDSHVKFTIRYTSMSTASWSSQPMKTQSWHAVGVMTPPRM